MRKLFTLFAATLFAFAANASTVVWDESFVESIDLYDDYANPELASEINNSYGGITITAVAKLPNGDLGIYDAGMFAENEGGTFTFTSTIGKISKIEILGPTSYDPGTGKPVTNFTEGGIISKDWDIISPYMVVGKGTTAAVWEDTPAEVVEMICDTLNIIHVTSIVFTIEDLEINFTTSPYTVISGTETLVSGSYHDDTHGYLSPVISTSLKAGNYKITVGNCQFGNQTGSLKNADGSATLNLIDSIGLTITSFTTPNNCYDGKATTTTSVWYVANEAQTVRIVCPQYTPYLKVERVNEVPAPPAMYTVTFVNNTEGVNGTVPSPIEVPVGDNITIPTNRTLYKEGYTLTCWSGTNNYVPGSLFEPTGNTTLTAIFTANTKELLSATNEVVVKWDFGEANGAPSMDYEGSNGFLVAQATVSGETQDVKLDILASSGSAKFFNSGRNDAWAQANAGTALIFPSKADATVEVKAYYQPLSNLLVDTQASTLEIGSEGNYVSTFATNPNFAHESRFSVIANNYLSYLQVTLPASDPTAIDNTNAEAKAVKRIVNGQLVIEKNGKFYNALGAEVK